MSGVVTCVEYFYECLRKASTGISTCKSNGNLTRIPRLQWTMLSEDGSGGLAPSGVRHRGYLPKSDSQLQKLAEIRIATVDMDISVLSVAKDNT